MLLVEMYFLFGFMLNDLFIQKLSVEYDISRSNLLADFFFFSI